MNCHVVYKVVILCFNIYGLLVAYVPIAHMFVKFNAPCQMNHTIFQSVKSNSIIQCAFLCDTNGFGPCSRFVWSSDTATCMLHSNNLYPGSSHVTVMSQIGWAIFGRKHADCFARGFDFESETMTCIGLTENRNVTWYEARSSCRQDGGDLISLTSTEKIQFALSYVNCKHKMWIGLTGYKWVTTEDFDEDGYGFEFQLNNFDKKFPDDKEMNCSILAPRSQHVFQDYSCSMSIRSKFLCEVVIA